VLRVPGWKVGQSAVDHQELWWTLPARHMGGRGLLRVPPGATARAKGAKEASRRERAGHGMDGKGGAPRSHPDACSAATRRRFHRCRRRSFLPPRPALRCLFKRLQEVCSWPLPFDRPPGDVVRALSQGALRDGGFPDTTVLGQVRSWSLRARWLNSAVVHSGVSAGALGLRGREQLALQWGVSRRAIWQRTDRQPGLLGAVPSRPLWHG